MPVFKALSSQLPFPASSCVPTPQALPHVVLTPLFTQYGSKSGDETESETDREGAIDLDSEARADERRGDQVVRKDFVGVLYHQSEKVVGGFGGIWAEEGE